MASKLKLDDQEFDIDDLSDLAKKQLALLQFTTNRMQELTNTQALLQRAKNSYMESLKKEMLSSKAGFSLSDD